MGFILQYFLPESSESPVVVWKAGRSRNFCEHIGAIADFLGVSAEYLLTGNIEGKLVENLDEQQLLNYFRKLDAEKQNAVLQNIKWLAE